MKTKNLIQQSKRAMKSFSLFTLLFSLALASCSKSDDVPTAPQGDGTTFTLAVEGAQTRGTVTPARYVMEVWSEDGTTAENVFGTGDAATHHAEKFAAEGHAFTAVLDKTKAYTCLFWADDKDTFNAENLKAISLNADKLATEAYFANVAVAKGKNPAVAVTLKRAVAKITLTETGTVKTDDNLALKLSNIYPTFSVLDGGASGTAAEWTKTIQPSAITGAIASFYLFAKAEKALSDLTFTYATETEKTVSNIPVQQNHATNIKGEYSNVSSFTFTISADDEWTTPENEMEFPQVMVGDFYYSDNTFSNTIDATKTCIGIVYIVNADGKTGKIVGLTEPPLNPTKPLRKWGPNKYETAVGIDSEIDGAAATKNMIEAYRGSTDFATNYPAFEWVYTTANNSDINGRWYLPAKDEVFALYAAWNAGTVTIANPAARTAFNAQLTAASGTVINQNGFYWSSTQYDNGKAWSVYFVSGKMHDDIKTDVSSVRVVSAF